MILCTGNPADHTVASAIKKLYPTADFASRATGYDFTTTHGIELFCQNIIKYNVFINSSYVKYDTQQILLDLAHKHWMSADVKGHIITLGSTIENSSTLQHQEYRDSKLNLRYRSLKLNEQTGISGVRMSYIIVGGINRGEKGQENYLDLDSVANAIHWIINNPNRVSLLQLESPYYKF